MVARVIGIGLLIVIGLPLAIAFSPLLIPGLVVWFLASRWWRERELGLRVPGHLHAALDWRPRTGWSSSDPDHHPLLSAVGQPEGRRRGAPTSALPALFGVVVFFSALQVVARQAPYLLVPVVVVGAVLVLRATTRPHARPAAPDRAPNPAALPSLTAAELEQRIARLLQEHQFHSLQRIGQPDSPGIDFIARDRHDRLYLVECQQYAVGNRVGSADVRRLVEAVAQERAAGGIFVTTGSFTQAAINLAQYSRVPILLYDGRALARFPMPVAWPAALHHANVPYARAMANR